MHDVAPFRISPEDIGYYFAESLGENAFVDIFYGVVYIFFGCGYSTQVVTLVAHGVVSLLLSIVETFRQSYEKMDEESILNLLSFYRYGHQRDIGMKQ
jgi:hypothetical protein